jgi:hypothetical protein
MLTMILQEPVAQSTGPPTPITIVCGEQFAVNPLVAIQSTTGGLTRTVFFHREEAQAFAGWLLDWVARHPGAT